MPLKQVQKKIQEFLCNGEQMWKIRPGSTRKARILVGHGLQEYLTSLQIDYPSIMIRDTAKYPPLMKTSKLSNSLHYLTQTYLGQVFHITLNSLIILLFFLPSLASYIPQSRSKSF
ncbi:hypothetical protein IC582_020830 [Cucumis melo]